MQELERLEKKAKLLCHSILAMYLCKGLGCHEVHFLIHDFRAKCGEESGACICLQKAHLPCVNLSMDLIISVSYVAMSVRQDEGSCRALEELQHCHCRCG